MLTKLRNRLTYANVVSTLCLFIVLGGSSYAAVTLKRNAVKGKHIAANAVTSPKVRDGALLAKDFAAGQLPAGQQGPQGQQGLQGERGLQGPADGPAGGDLTGSYPNPLIAPDAVGGTEIVADSVGSSEIAPSIVGADELDTVHEHFGPATSITTDPTAHDGSYTLATASVSCGAGEDLLSVSVDWTANGGHNERQMVGVSTITRGEPDSATVEVSYDGGLTTATFVPVATCIF